MPTYNFKCSSCEKVFERVCRIADMKTQSCDCGSGDYEVYHDSSPALGDPVRLGIRTPDAGFKEVLSKIHSKTYKSNLGDKLSRS